ncbi:hypothetical protein [Mesorhizobium kowhaii]|uniref:hypothetical protein n=1 Tax=Mesorhizobium kowhaii TaxID=1300272 RepID=UPI00142DA10F
MVGLMLPVCADAKVSGLIAPVSAAALISLSMASPFRKIDVTAEVWIHRDQTRAALQNPLDPGIADTFVPTTAWVRPPLALCRNRLTDQPEVTWRSLGVAVRCA